MLMLIGLLALALALSPAFGPQIKAQAPIEEEEPESVLPDSAGAEGPSSAETPAQPDFDWPHSSEPGDAPSQFYSPESVEEINATVSLRVTGSVLRPRESDVTFAVGSGGGCIYAASGDTNTVWNTPLYLPQGSTVTYLRMYIYDTSTANSYGWLTYYDLYGNLVNEWGVGSSGTPGNDYYDVAIDNHVIDYANYSYVLNWRPLDTGSDMQLCGFRIFYTPPPGYTYLPNIQRNFP